MKPRPVLKRGTCNVCKKTVLVVRLAGGPVVAAQHPEPTPEDLIGCRGSGVQIE